MAWNIMGCLDAAASCEVHVGFMAQNGRFPQRISHQTVLNQPDQLVILMCFSFKKKSNGGTEWILMLDVLKVEKASKSDSLLGSVRDDIPRNVEGLCNQLHQNPPPEGI